MQLAGQVEGGARMSTKEHELSRIEFEMALNKAMDEYFNARPALEKSISNENLFKGGFRMAWEIWMGRV